MLATFWREGETGESSSKRFSEVDNIFLQSRQTVNIGTCASAAVRSNYVNLVFTDTKQKNSLSLDICL